MYDAEPWGDERADFAVGTAIMHQVASHGGEAHPPLHYMRFLKRPKEKPQSQDEMKAIFGQACAEMNKAAQTEGGEA